MAVRLVQDKVGKEVWPLATEEVLPECLAWLREKGELPQDIIADDLKPELEIANALVPLPTLCPVSPKLDHDPYSWVLPGLFGSVFGGLLLGWKGSVLFTVLCIAGLGWLLRRPGVRTALDTGAVQYEQENSEKSSLPVFLSALVMKFQVWFVRLVMRPHEDAQKVSFTAAQLRQYVEDYYTACADLVLTACWVRATSKRAATVVGTGKDKTPDSLFESIGVLQRSMETVADDPLALQDAAQELLQAFSNEGYTWESVERGTPFEKKLLKKFKTYGHVAEGQPVKMFKSALCKQGTVIIRGIVKKI
jgi:hypothetical protein